MIMNSFNIAEEIIEYNNDIIYVKKLHGKWKKNKECLGYLMLLKKY